MVAQTLRKTDKIEVHVGVDGKEREVVCKKLSGLLATTYLVYLKTLYYHWNVTGPNFVGLHGLFEQQYTELQLAGDELAERIRALGHFTPGTVAEFISMSSIKDDSQLPRTSEEMVRNLLAANEQCAKEARQVLEAAESVKDEVTMDMMIERMTHHDKAAWMLRAILQ